jgi:MFS transporter, DHA1 family, quinolone resistance protein
MPATRSIEWRYYFVTFLFWFSTALPMAIFILLARARGLSLAELGLLTAIYSATIVLLELPTGGLADALGRARIAALSEAITLAGWILFLLSFSFPMFLIAFILNGVGRALSSGALDAWFVDALIAADPAVDLHPRLARAGAVTLVALGLGTLTGGAISQAFSFLPPDGTAILTPLAVPGVIALPLRCLLMVAIVTLIREPRSSFQRRHAILAGFSAVPQLLRDAAKLTADSRVLLRLLAVSAASGLVLSGLETLWQPRFAALIGSPATLSLLLSALLAGSFLFGVAGNLLAPHLARRLGDRPAAVCAVFHGLRGAFLVGLALQHGPMLAGMFFWLVYLGQGVVLSTHSLLLNEQIPSARRSSMLSIQSLVSYLGGILGSAGLGFIADRTSIPVAWGVAGGVLLVSWVLYLRIDAVRKESRERSNTLPEPSYAAPDAV